MTTTLAQFIQKACAPYVIYDDGDLQRVARIVTSMAASRGYPEREALCLATEHLRTRSPSMRRRLDGTWWHSERDQRSRDCLATARLQVEETQS